MSHSKIIGIFLGCAIGDALGLPHEISPISNDLEQIQNQVINIRKSFLNEITDYETGGQWQDQGYVVQKGEWSDDTSMMLCLADSLIENKKIIVSDLMKRFITWWSSGYNSCLGKSIGLGGNIGRSLNRFNEDEPEKLQGGTDPTQDSGNGSLMRLGPIPIFYTNKSLKEAIEAAKYQTATTHNTPEALDASALMCFFIWLALKNYSKSFIFDNLWRCELINDDIKELSQINAKWKNKNKNEIRTLPGRCLWSLEAAFWCIYHTDTFEDALILAINLSGDADTIGAITGQLAGAIYGCSMIPMRWYQGLQRVDKIIDTAKRLIEKI
jgi:ADP-ribosyl-[dinitrogen reductase] hydrolase